MPVISDAIIGGIAWEAFSKSVSFYAGKANDFALRVYVTQQLRALEQLEGASPKQIEEATDIIETTVIDTPEEIKQIEEPQKQQEAFEKYSKIKIKNLYGVGVVNGGNVTQTFNF